MTAALGHMDEAAATEAPEIVRRDGAGSALIVCEHASCFIPPRYRDLGLPPAERRSHAAWDPGARDISLALSEALNAPMVAARVSRLVYDCNRPPDAPGAMTAKSERIDVPGNRNLDAAARIERTEAVYKPFCAAVEGLIDRRLAAGLATAMITVHSFTPTWFDVPRETEIGILHDEDARLADAMLARANLLAHRTVARNDPYGPGDGVTHSLRIHGLANRLPNVMIEVRNDLLGTVDDRNRIVEELLTLLRPALAELAAAAKGGKRSG